MYANPVLAAAMPINNIKDPRSRIYIEEGKQNEEDIVDDIKGSIRYRERVINSRFAFENKGRNVLLMMGIDGFVPYEKSVANLWPILFQVINLPEVLRTKYYNFILAGVIACHPTNLQTYMHIVVDELCRLYNDGMVIKDAANDGEEVRIKVMLLGTKADYPARSSLNCQKTHAAYSGCHICSILGYQASHTRRFDVHGPGTFVKTHDQLKAAAALLVQDKQSNEVRSGSSPTDIRVAHERYMGMTGYPALFRLPYDFDIVKDSMLDVMHVLEGVIYRMVIGLMKIDPPAVSGVEATDSRQMNWSLTQHQQNLCDDLCAEIQAPGDVTPANQKPFQRAGTSPSSTASVYYFTSTTLLHNAHCRFVCFALAFMIVLHQV